MAEPTATGEERSAGATGETAPDEVAAEPAAEPARSGASAEPAEPTHPAESADPIPPVESAEPEELIEPPSAPGPTESSGQAEPAAPAASADTSTTARPGEPGDSAAAGGETGPGEAVDPVPPVEPIEAAGATRSGEPAPADEAVTPADDIAIEPGNGAETVDGEAEQPADGHLGRTPRAPDGEPELPEDIQYSDLDAEARRELRSLAKPTAELVGRHLVAAGRLIDDDPELALRHARFARSRAARVALVREAAGLAAYHAGEWAEALGELRAARRMSGGQAHLPVMADCERALGRPERALELAAEAKDLPKDVAVELKIVAAGARRDMGQLDAAVVALQGPDLDPAVHERWSPRLFYAYADNLEAAGRTDDAIRWFLNAAEADLDEETDAAERAFTLRDADAGAE